MGLSRLSSHKVGYYRYVYRGSGWIVEELKFSFLHGFIEYWELVMECDSMAKARDISRKHNKENNLE